MSENNHADNSYAKILPTAPGANPSSFPDPAVPIELEMTGARQRRAEQIELPDGNRIAPNGAVIEDPSSAVPEVLPPNEYTPDKEDLDLLIM